MKKKQKDLLNEATVRKFMKLAGVGRLAENFMESFQEEEDPEDELGADSAVPPAPEGELPPPDMGGEEEAGLEPEVGAEGPEADEDMVTRLVDAIGDAITDATGISVDVSSSEGGGEDLAAPEGEEMPPLDDAPEAPMPPEESAPPAEEEPEPLDEALPGLDEPPVEESKEFGGTGKTQKSAKLSAAKSPESAIKASQSKAVTKESKKPISAKEQLINEVCKRVVARLKSEAAAAKKGKK
jgi:hypothetical protein